MPHLKLSPLTLKYAMTFTDTHCHIHEESYADQEGAYQRAMTAGVKRLLCVGTDSKSSREAVLFAQDHDMVWATIGLHPHDASTDTHGMSVLRDLLQIDAAANDKQIVAIGECGLDYFYEHSPRDKQIEMLSQQLALAKEFDLPVVFHVREASSPDKQGSVWNDFWPLFDQHPGLRGVLHSFTDIAANLEKGLARGLYIGVNGISTFTKDEKQQQMFASLPLERLLFETDAPYLSPAPYRGGINEPAHILSIAEHQAHLMNTSLEELAHSSETNVHALFNIT